MSLAYILIDFENVQPNAAELSSIRGADYLVRMFHGPHQNKFDAGIVKALQPLGSQVEYVQCARKGKNALDFRIAFCLGKIIEQREAAVSPNRRQARFVVVSKDAGFDELLDHVRTLGFEAARVESIRDALAPNVPVAATLEVGTKVEPPLPAPQSGNVASHSAKSSHVNPTPASPTLPSAATATKPSPAAAKTAAAKKPSLKKATKAPPKSAKKAAVPDPWAKTVANLRDHPKNRPSTVAALERHLKTMLGNGATAEKSQAMVRRLEREGLATIANGKVEYRIPDK
jgi:hypothetical protein